MDKLAEARGQGFADDLRYSESVTVKAIMRAAYERVFGPGIEIQNEPNNRAFQYSGVDAVIHRPGKPPIAIEEKARRRWYGPDIALEYRAGDGSGVGWIEKRLSCDGIAYAVIDQEKRVAVVWIINYADLARAWLANKAAWVQRYTRKASNTGRHGGTTAYNACVPVAELKAAGVRIAEVNLSHMLRG